MIALGGGALPLAGIIGENWRLTGVEIGRTLAKRPRWALVLPMLAVLGGKNGDGRSTQGVCGSYVLMIRSPRSSNKSRPLSLAARILIFFALPAFLPNCKEWGREVAIGVGGGVTKLSKKLGDEVDLLKCVKECTRNANNRVLRAASTECRQCWPSRICATCFGDKQVQTVRDCMEQEGCSKVVEDGCDQICRENGGDR